MTGIIQWKGRVHMTLCEPIHAEDLAAMEGLTNNEYHKAVAGLIDRRINGAYQLWPNNYVAHDMLYGNERYRGMYTDEEREAFYFCFRLILAAWSVGYITAFIAQQFCQSFPLLFNLIEFLLPHRPRRIWLILFL